MAEETKTTKYWLDTEFIEDGKTIDLVSIGIVAEDGRELYLQRPGATFAHATDWVARNVFPSLVHFDMARMQRSCTEQPMGMSIYDKDGRCSRDCPWRSPREFRDEIIAFCDPESHGKPEFWGYYADYDWVVLCQLFGTMMGLPKGWPMYCRDIKQLCDDKGNPPLPEQGKGEHHALADARWNKVAWEFLGSLS